MDPQLLYCGIDDDNDFDLKNKIYDGSLIPVDQQRVDDVLYKFRENSELVQNQINLYAQTKSDPSLLSFPHFCILNNQILAAEYEIVSRTYSNLFQSDFYVDVKSNNGNAINIFTRLSFPPNIERVVRNLKNIWNSHLLLTHHLALGMENMINHDFQDAFEFFGFCFKNSSLYFGDFSRISLVVQVFVLIVFDESERIIKSLNLDLNNLENNNYNEKESILIDLSVRIIEFITWLYNYSLDYSNRHKIPQNSIFFMLKLKDNYVNFISNQFQIISEKIELNPEIIQFVDSNPFLKKIFEVHQNSGQPTQVISPNFPQKAKMDIESSSLYKLLQEKTQEFNSLFQSQISTSNLMIQEFPNAFKLKIKKLKIKN
ncbi:hypothetical protein M0811_13409 [Anaeramoeba ignava]|uniref:Uncharacterized protein n=1 Tax=Anaeramoeba ignava TaxID=1746090 RepID=A0A9Q0L6D0_ANAIG|nr:hypothetical protein M0811_13409 [Anaeramoeba ignava]